MKQQTILVCLAAVLASACGGGGHDDVTSPSTFDVNAAMASLLTQGMNFSDLKASSSISPPGSTVISLVNNSYGLTFSFVPTTDGERVPGGEIFKKSVQTSSTAKNGVQLGASSATYYYKLNPTQLVADARSDGQVVSYASSGALPTAALVGQSGTFNTFTVTGAAATGVTTWSLEPDSASTAWACFTTTTTASAASPDKYCYRISPAGAISDAKVTITVDARVMTFTGANISMPAKVANAAPVANAGTAQNVLVGTVVNLDGSASSDANRDALTYLWVMNSKPVGSAAVLSNATSVKPSFTADVSGTYQISLVVNDGQVSSSVASVTVTAGTVTSGGGTNTAPVADAGIAQTVSAGTVVTLDGTASSDADRDPLTFRWVLTSKPAGSAAILSDTTAVRPSFIADVAGTYLASLNVNDGKVNSSVATTIVTAVAPNQLSIRDLIKCLPDSLSCEGQPVSLPYSVGTTQPCNGASCTVGVFRLFASGQSFTITNVEALNTTSGSTVSPAFLGLASGQTITAGQTAIFSLLAGVPTAPTILTYKFTVKETGATFLYTVQVLP